LKPGTFVDVIELLIPELRKRGLFWDDYEVKGGTYRENLYREKGLSAPPQDHPAAKYQWRAGVAQKDHVIPAEPQSNGSVEKKVEPESLKRLLQQAESGNVGRQTRKRTKIAA